MAITTIEASDQISDSRTVINANFSDLDTTKLDTDGDASSLTGITKAQVSLNNVDNVKQMPLSYLDDDSTMSAPSSEKVPSTKAIKTYVDNNLNGLKWKEPVVAATAAAGTMATSFANGQTMDTSITLATGNRILIKDQVDKSQNGIYVVKDSGAPDRATDADDDSELPGASCLVSGGTANANKVFTCSDSVVEIGVSDINFVAVSGGASVYTAGTGLDLTGNTFSIDETVADLSSEQTFTNKTLTSPAITTPTGIVKGDVGLGNVDNTSDATKNAASATLTNKTINSSNNTIAIKEAALSFTNITTANTSSTKHGLCPRLTNTGTKYLRDDGIFALPPTGSGDCIAPETNTDAYIPQWNGADSKTLKDGLEVPAGGLAGLTALGAKEDSANKENTTMDTSTTKFPTNRLAKEYSDTKLATAGGTMTGKIVKAGTTEVGKTYTPATGSQTVTIDCSVNNVHIVSGHANGTAITFAISNATSSQPFIISVLQGSGTVSTIAAWFATVRWAGGSAPTLTATLNKRDTFGFIRTGTDTYDGFVIGQNA